MRSAKRLGLMAAAGLLLASGAHGYYHFVHYLTRTGPFRPIPEKLDLNTLPGRTLQYVIADAGPSQLAAGDSFAAVVSQIRLAANTWNQVPTSALRLVFGGLVAPGTAHSAPVVEVMFDEIAPGLVAFGGPTTRSTVLSPDASFVPILRSAVVLNKDLTQRPSWTEGFSLSVAHEFGHAVGLQHTMTSSLMSTELTRATTKSRPLSADDAIAISLLYPTGSFAESAGSISGRVAVGAEGVNLASVVALSSDGTAISGVTNPDGTYRIEGLPPGSYYVYAHPLPPPVGGEPFPAGIIPPLSADGVYLPGSAAFDSVFYPGVKDPAAASFVVVSRGLTTERIDFGVTRRIAPAVYAVQTFSFPGQVAVKPAHLMNGGSRNFILATGVGLTANTGVSVMGGSVGLAPGGVKPYTFDQRFVQMDFQLNLGFPGEGARHMTFTSDGDLYVLPAAFRLVRTEPPQITAVARGFDAEGRPAAIVSGLRLDGDTRILFDGVTAAVVARDEFSGTVTVTPPPAPFGHTAKVVALNGDGQSSLFLQGNPPVYTYETSDQPSVTVSPSSLAPGMEAMIEVFGAGTSFGSQAELAFGSSDVVVRRVWVLGPGRILANVAVSPQATPGALHSTVANGLRLHTSSFGFQVAYGNPAQPQFRGGFSDAGSGRSAVAAGATAAIDMVNLRDGEPAQVTVGGVAATVVSFQGGRLLFQVPAGLSPGPSVVRVTVSGEAAPPLVLQVDTPFPQIAGITAPGGVRVELARPAMPGETLTVAMRNLGEANAEIAAYRVTVRVDGVAHPALHVGSRDDFHTVQFVLDPAVGSGPHELVVSVDGRDSAPQPLPVR